LWAELYTIARSNAHVNAMTIWRADEFDRFDFSSNGLAIEVKAATGQLRVHDFALEQLAEPANGSGFVISMLLQPITGGTSVLDLVSTIEASIATNPKLRQKLWENVITDLGSDFNKSLDRRFDMSYADRHLKIFRFQDVPKPPPINDPRVARVRFAADCNTATSTLKDSSVASIQSLFSQLSSPFSSNTWREAPRMLQSPK